LAVAVGDGVTGSDAVDLGNLVHAFPAGEESNCRGDHARAPRADTDLAHCAHSAPVRSCATNRAMRAAKVVKPARAANAPAGIPMSTCHVVRTENTTSRADRNPAMIRNRTDQARVRIQCQSSTKRIRYPSHKPSRIRTAAIPRAAFGCAETQEAAEFSELVNFSIAKPPEQLQTIRINVDCQQMGVVQPGEGCVEMARMSLLGYFAPAGMRGLALDSPCGIRPGIGGRTFVVYVVRVSLRYSAGAVCSNVFGFRSLSRSAGFSMRYQHRMQIGRVAAKSTKSIEYPRGTCGSRSCLTMTWNKYSE